MEILTSLRETPKPKMELLDYVVFFLFVLGVFSGTGTIITALYFLI
jgi:hypothetical protein